MCHRRAGTGATQDSGSDIVWPWQIAVPFLGRYFAEAGPLFNAKAFELRLSVNCDSARDGKRRRAR